MFLKPPKGVLIERGDPYARGLAALWGMNEGGGNKVFDLSGNGHNGTLTDGAFFTAGINGPSVQFDGVNDYINIGNFTVPENCTIAAMVKVPTVWVENYPTLFAAFMNADNRSAFRLAENAGAPRWYVRKGGSTDRVDGSGALAAGWHHIAGVYAVGQAMELYVDGLSDATGHDGIAGTIASTDTRIGCYPGAVISWLTGNVDHMAIWNRGLSAGEILRLCRDMFR